MAGSVLALAVLVVLPLAFLVWGSVNTDGHLTLAHFRDAVSSRLYTQALRNSLILGISTAGLSVAVGLPLAWAVSRTNVPGKQFIHLTAIVSYLTPPFLTAIAFVNLFSPRAGLVNRFVRDVLGMPALTFDVFSMAGLILVTVPHTFPFVYLLAASALESVDASMEESAQILGASRWRTVAAVTGPLVAPAILSGALVAFVNAIALFGSQAIVGLPGRVFTLPTRIYALFDYPPQYGLASALSLIFVALTVAALYLQRRLAGLERRYPSELSGGQQQRVALARSLVVEPGILLLDEPLSNLDAKLRERMRWELKELQRRTGITFVYVTHDQSEAMALSDRIAVMHGGEIMQLGEPRAVYTRPANRTVADFMGLVNLIPGRVIRAAGDDSLVAVGGEHPIAAALSQSAVGGQAVQVAIRPESLRLTPPALASTADPLGTVPGKVADVTFLGNIIDCHVTLDDGTRVRVQVDSSQTLEVGQRVGVRFDSQQSSVFS